MRTAPSLAGSTQPRTLYAQNQISEALTILEQALQLAQPAGFTRIFIDVGPTLRTMLESLAQAKVDSSLSQCLSKLLNQNWSETTATQPTKPTIEATPLVNQTTFKPILQPVRKIVTLIEPLTEGEQEVLRLLATPAMDSTEIATTLSIAVSTLRTHIKNIYAKLEVQNRLQAIRRARELNLLAV